MSQQLVFPKFILAWVCRLEGHFWKYIYIHIYTYIKYTYIYKIYIYNHAYAIQLHIHITKAFFNNQMIQVHSLTYFFICINKTFDRCYQVNQVCCFPGNMYNFWTDWSIKCFRLYIATQKEHAIDIKGKDLFLIK